MPWRIQGPLTWIQFKPLQRFRFGLKNGLGEKRATKVWNFGQISLEGDKRGPGNILFALEAGVIQLSDVFIHQE